MKNIILVLILSISTFGLELFANQYTTQGDCGGYPKIDVKTAPGFCLGLVYEPKNIDGPTPQKMRWAVELNNGKILLSDIVSFGGSNGFVYLLDLQKKPQSLQTLISSEKLSSLSINDPKRRILEQPNQMILFNDQKVYVGTSGAVLRFDPYAEDPISTIELIINDIPRGGLHSLKSFVFDIDGNILINVGSDSNVCQNYTKFADPNPINNPINFAQKQYDECPEVESQLAGRGQIRKYLRNKDGTYSTKFIVYAKGLRNSIALAWNFDQKYLLQGENSRDAIVKFNPSLSNADTPEDELNLILDFHHYGWPYCYANNLNSPEWTNIDCSKYSKPQVLLPAHSAPLGMLFYKGNLFPKYYKNKLMMSLHGYEDRGHRIVTFNSDDHQLPLGNPLSVVYDWEPRGNQGKGKPVSLVELQDGSVLIVEDDPNNTLLRLYFESSKGDGTPVYEINKPIPISDETSPAQEEIRKNRLNQKTFGGNLSAFTKFEINVIDKTCYLCHQSAGAPGVRLLRYDDDGNAKRIIDANKQQLILSVIKGNTGAPAMPPSGWDSAEEQQNAIKLIEEWIN